MIKADIDVISKPCPVELPHAVEVFMDIMDSVASEYGHGWSFVGGFARDRLLGFQPNDFDVATWNNHHFQQKLSEIGCLRIGQQTEPRRKPHDYFTSPFEFAKKEHEIHWIEADMEQAFAPTRFDFTLNHFAMKSDKRIYAPTYAWKDVSRKILRVSDEAPRSTNVMLRAVRFASKYEFQIEKKTREFIEERIRAHRSGDDKMGDDIVIMNLEKMIKDGVQKQCFKLMKELDFPNIHAYDSLEDLMDYHQRRIDNHENHVEPRNDYED